MAFYPEQSEGQPCHDGRQVYPASAAEGRELARARAIRASLRKLIHSIKNLHCTFSRFAVYKLGV
jgi:hypothetical protein